MNTLETIPEIIDLEEQVMHLTEQLRGVKVDANVGNYDYAGTLDVNLSTLARNINRIQHNLRLTMDRVREDRRTSNSISTLKKPVPDSTVPAFVPGDIVTMRADGSEGVVSKSELLQGVLRYEVKTSGGKVWVDQFEISSWNPMRWCVD